MNLPRNCESRISSARFRGQSLVPNPESIVQEGPTCVFYAIVACAIMQLRLTMFKMGLICNIFFDAHSFVSRYVRRYGPLDRDPGPREKRALIMFRDEGIPAYDFSGSPPYIPRLMKIKEFTSFPPLPDPSRPGAQLVLTFEFVAYLIQQGRPVLGCFPVRLDKDIQGFTEFEKLGDKIYDYWSPTLPYNPNLQPATHLVTFVDYGKAEGRAFLKFVNTHDRSWGADGFGKIFFNCIYQKDDTFCFHVLSFDEPLPSSSSPPSPTAVSDRFTLPPPPTVQPPFRGWHGIQITEPIYEAAQVRTVKVTEISLSATVQDCKELFSFSGDTEHVEMQSDDEVSQLGAYVTTKYAQGAHTLHLPSPAPEHQPRPTASAPPVRTVKVTHVSLSATVQDIKEFFSFSGDIEHVDMQSGDEWSQIAYVAFKDSQEVEAAALLSGSTLLDLSVIIQPDPEYQPPPTTSAPLMIGDRVPVGGDNVAEDVASTVLAKEGKDAVSKAESFDEKHGSFTSTAGAKMLAIDDKIEQITLDNEKAREMDQKLPVSDKTKVRIGCCRADGEQRRVCCHEEHQMTSDRRENAG